MQWKSEVQTAHLRWAALENNSNISDEVISAASCCLGVLPPLFLSCYWSTFQEKVLNRVLSCHSWNHIVHYFYEKLFSQASRKSVESFPSFQHLYGTLWLPAASTNDDEFILVPFAVKHVVWLWRTGIMSPTAINPDVSWSAANSQANKNHRILSIDFRWATSPCWRNPQTKTTTLWMQKGALSYTTNISAFFRETSTGWRNGPTGTSRGLRKRNAKPCAWGGRTPSTSTY